MEQLEQWGIDIFSINTLTENHPLSCITYSIIKVLRLGNLFLKKNDNVGWECVAAKIPIMRVTKNLLPLKSFLPYPNQLSALKT